MSEILEDRLTPAEQERRLTNDDGYDGDNEDESAEPAGRPPTKVEIANYLQQGVPDTYLVDEAITASWARKLHSDWKFEPEQYQLNKGAGLGYGLPAAVGAAIAEEERDEPRPIVGYVGDGGTV